MSSVAQESAPESRPARVFLSYKRHAEPDETLARTLFESLNERNYSIFIDRLISPAEIWAKRIEAEVRSSDWLIVLLSESSCRSEMLKGEIELAKDEASKSGGRPRILPIRAAFGGRLPYPLDAYLDPIQHAVWGGYSDTTRLIEEVTHVLANGTVPQRRTLSHAPSHAIHDPPSYSAPMNPPGGTADITDPFYIVRASERKALHLIEGNRLTIVVKGPRQTGKSSLLNRLAVAAMEKGKRVALIDLQLFDRTMCETAERFFSEFGRALAEALDLPAQPVPTDLSAGSYLRNCTAFVEKHILKVLDQPVLFAIDEADRVFGAPWQVDFFGMLRHWHNRRADPTKGRVWSRLDLALVSATEPYMFIPSDAQSPFNVGSVFRLEDFSMDQVHSLNQLHGHVLSSEGADRLHQLIGGHPYLTRRALYEIAQSRQVTPDALFEQTLEDEGPFRDHLRHYCLALQRRPELAVALCEIASGEPCRDETVFCRLEGAGLIKRHQGKAVPRCLLYGEYFRTHLRRR